MLTELDACGVGSQKKLLLKYVWIKKSITLVKTSLNSGANLWMHFRIYPLLLVDVDGAIALRGNEMYVFWLMQAFSLAGLVSTDV